MIDLALSSLILQIESKVIKMKIKRVLKRLLRGKALDLNKISNKVLILLALDISINLTQTMSLAFITRTLSFYLKKSITLALQKENKKNYFLLGNYHLIALKNILMKIVEKILIN
jgi:hypothetical protein